MKRSKDLIKIFKLYRWEIFYHLETMIFFTRLSRKICFLYFLKLLIRAIWINWIFGNTEKSNIISKREVNFCKFLVCILFLILRRHLRRLFAITHEGTISKKFLHCLIFRICWSWLDVSVFPGLGCLLLNLMAAALLYWLLHASIKQYYYNR